MRFFNHREINIKIDLTFSKIMAFLIFGVVSYIDISQKTGGAVVMFAIPFVAIMLGVKQVVDGRIKAKELWRTTDSTDKKQ